MDEELKSGQVAHVMMDFGEMERKLDMGDLSKLKKKIIRPFLKTYMKVIF